MNADRMEAVQNWAKRFAYVADKGDHWTIPSMVHPRGDCEDFALGAAYILAGKSIPRMLWMIITRQVGLFTGKSRFNGIGHAALLYRGRWIDTGTRLWTPQPRLADAKRVPFPRLLRELGYLRPVLTVVFVVAAASFAWALS